MRIKDWLRILLVFSVVLLLFTMPMFTACGGGDGEQEEEEEEEEEEEASEFEIVMAAIEDYLADKAGNTSAADLAMAIAGDTAPYIVSIRSADSYDAGHISGAVNMTFGQLTTLADDEEILVYCYTGQSGSFAAAMLGVLDYDVQNLLHGMCAWSTDEAVTGTGCFDASRDQGDYAVEDTANTATTTYDYPDLDNTTSTDEDTIIEKAAATVSPSYITAADLSLAIAGDEDMTIIDARSATDYAAGHIPGAINVGIGDLPDYLDNIDPDSPVYVYCYTGHTAAQVAALLQMLGYDASSVKFGMCSWSSDPDINMNKCFDASKVTGYDVE